MKGETGTALWGKLQAFYLDRWRLTLIIVWLLYCVWIVVSRWAQIKGFALSDTDDNLRMAQVRAFLDGQGWYDLTQYRFDPAHGGANIHWSRLVDLPIAGLILLFKPFLGVPWAERLAAGFAPLLPLLVMMFALATTMRRLVSEQAWVLPLIALLSAYNAIGMFAPNRIDHHGWQLAFLAWAVAGVADKSKVRGGLTLGVASGLSLAIGLEMLIYLALLGGAMVLMWVANRVERDRLAAYAVALSGATIIAYLLFASNANRQAMCDALSPVWLGDAMVGGAVMLLLSRLPFKSWPARLGAALVGGAIVAGFHAFTWPHCLERLEGVSEDATKLWLNHVKEARPFYRFDWRTATVAVALPVTGLIGWGILIFRAAKGPFADSDRLRRTLAAALPAVAALALMFWQMRGAPAAQMLALVGASSIAALYAKQMLDAPRLWLHAVAVVLVLISLGALVPLVVGAIPKDQSNKRELAVRKANGKCPTVHSMNAVNKQPKGMIFTFIDLGPRLINTTHHDAVGGPYHRNDRAIADVMKAFRGDTGYARLVINEYQSDYVLICPDMSTATIFMSEAPKGFYAQLAKGQVPAWLEPVNLGKDIPLKMWKVKR